MAVLGRGLGLAQLQRGRCQFHLGQLAAGGGVEPEHRVAGAQPGHGLVGALAFAVGARCALEAHQVVQRGLEADGDLLRLRRRCRVLATPCTWAWPWASAASGAASSRLRVRRFSDCMSGYSVRVAGQGSQSLQAHARAGAPALPSGRQKSSEAARTMPASSRAWLGHVALDHRVGDQVAAGAHGGVGACRLERAVDPHRVHRAPALQRRARA